MLIKTLDRFIHGLDARTPTWTLRQVHAQLNVVHEDSVKLFLEHKGKFSLHPALIVIRVAMNVQVHPLTNA